MMKSCQMLKRLGDFVQFEIEKDGKLKTLINLVLMYYKDRFVFVQTMNGNHISHLVITIFGSLLFASTIIIRN